jgi:hypothetical protein
MVGDLNVEFSPESNRITSGPSVVQEKLVGRIADRFRYADFWLLI